jgi:hypothetical protein
MNFAAFRAVSGNDEMQLCHEGRRRRVAHYAGSQFGTGGGPGDSAIKVLL